MATSRPPGTGPGNQLSIRLTEDLSLELVGKNIQVNVMWPGSHRTGLVDEMWDSGAAAGVTERLEETRQQMVVQGLAKYGTSFSVSLERATDLAVYLASDVSGSLSGRCFEAVDDFLNLSHEIPEIMASDAYTLRRVELE